MLAMSRREKGGDVKSSIELTEEEDEGNLIEDVEGSLDGLKEMSKQDSKEKIIIIN
jgi:hypothetical protein